MTLYYLKEIGEIVTGATPKKVIDGAYGSNIPFLTPSDYTGARLTTVTARGLSEIGITALQSRKLSPNSVSVTSIGSDMGKTQFNPQSVVTNQQINSIHNIKAQFLPMYVYYKLLSMHDFLYHLGSGNGSTMPILNKTDFSNIQIEIPSKKTQEEVVSYLDPLDSMIELLTTINDNLLDLSMTHFEHWLETTSSTNNVSLDEIATYKNGLAMQKFEPEDGADSLPVLKIRELNQGFTDSSSNKARTDIDESVKVYDGDVIFSWSGTLLVDIWTGGPAGLNQHLFKVTSATYPKWFYYMWTCFHLRQFQQIAAGKATTMGHIKRGDLKAANVIIPTDSEFVQLETLLKPAVDAYIENGVEIKNLQTIRDQLLQKLLG